MKRVVVVGGGAAGFFGAIACAEKNPAADVTLYEASARVLAKVRISGGGRCNVTHACSDLREFAGHYPRGSRELLGPLHRFGPSETVEWFARRGVELRIEGDGRMFPVTDDSSTIVDCLVLAARKAGVRVITERGVTSIVHGNDGAFLVGLSTRESVSADRVLLATGGGQGSRGAEIAKLLGHTIEPPVPSLFTFHVEDPRIRGLEGVSLHDVEVCVPGTGLRETGAILVTHWGLSGPAILRLSAWGARELHRVNYRFKLRVNWSFPRRREQMIADLDSMRRTHPRRRVVSEKPFAFPARLWERLLGAAGIHAGANWATVSNAQLDAVGLEFTAGEFAVSGKSPNKEEFVTCGGVRLREVDFRTCESRVCPGIYFAGEMLDIDGVTGGFNFQAAWTTGRLAGDAMAAS